MTDRTCRRCGDPLTSTNRRATYCSPTCRRQAHEARQAGRPESLVRNEAASSVDLEPGRVRESLEMWLAARDVESHPLAASALALAGRIDTDGDGAAGLAAVVRALDRLLESMTANGPTEIGYLDLMQLAYRVRRIDRDAARRLAEVLTPDLIRRLNESSPNTVYSPLLVDGAGRSVASGHWSDLHDDPADERPTSAERKW